MSVGDGSPLASVRTDRNVGEDSPYVIVVEPFAVNVIWPFVSVAEAAAGRTAAIARATDVAADKLSLGHMQPLITPSNRFLR
jgi:hypothetical protein